MRDDSIWNRTLFVVPPWIKVAFRLLAASIMVAVTIGILFVSWRGYKGFSLIGPATGIPGWIVLAELHLFAIFGLITAYRLLRARGFEAGGGVSFGCMGLLCNPNKLSGVRGEEFAEAFPILFWFSTIVLILHIGLFIWLRYSRERAHSSKLTPEALG